VADAVATAMAGPAGDPGRIHTEGMTARVALEDARATIAAALGARPREVVLTSGATEAVAAAAWGAAERGSHLVLSAVEHSCVRAAADMLVEAGTHTLTVVGVDRAGRVDADEVLAAVGDHTALVALQWANHEVGTRQPVAEVAAALGAHPALLLVDAAAAVGHDPISFSTSGIDLLAFSGHKLGGPPGTGGLCIRRGLRLRPLLRGGEQERARRAGLENLPGARGLAAAMAGLADPDALTAADAVDRARTERVADVLGSIDGIERYGHRDDRVGHIVCLGFTDVEPQAVVLGLDRAGVAVHSGSACASEGLEPSPVLAAMGVDAHRSLRVSVGWNTTDDDIDAVVEHLPRVLAELRALR
jgi:cysteine desulfurase